MYGSELCARNVMSNRHIANDFVLWAGRSSMRPLVETFFCATRRSTSSMSNSSCHAGLDDLIGDPLTRKHMENLAQKGWSQVEGGAVEAETESQKGARIIAKNFGAIIARQTTTFFDEALKEDMFRDPDAVRVLIPPTTYARKCIQRMVDTVKPSNLDFKERLFFWSNHSSL